MLRANCVLQSCSIALYSFLPKRECCKASSCYLLPVSTCSEVLWRTNMLLHKFSLQPFNLVPFLSGFHYFLSPFKLLIFSLCNSCPFSFVHKDLLCLKVHFNCHLFGEDFSDLHEVKQSLYCSHYRTQDKTWCFCLPCLSPLHLCSFFYDRDNAFCFFILRP